MSLPVQLFVTCIVDTFYPEIGEAVVSLLKQTGCEVQFPPDQTCCGQPAFNAGMRQEAQQIARHTIQVLEHTSGPVVIPSGSCAAMIRHSYPELFAHEPEWLERSRRLGERTYELSEFLVDQLGVSGLGIHLEGRIAYHASCHLLRELGVDHQPRQLLTANTQAEIVALPGDKECCGFGGVFSAEHPELSGAMLERKLANIAASQADWVVACDAGCLTHINGGLRRQGLKPCAVHIAQALTSNLE